MGSLRAANYPPAMPADPLEIMDMRDELRRTEAWRIRGDIARLIRSWRLFVANREELEGVLHDVTAPVESLELWAQDNRDEFDEFLREVERLLHNFVAGAMTLVAHSRDTVARRPAQPDDKLAERLRHHQGRSLHGITEVAVRSEPAECDAPRPSSHCLRGEQLVA